MLPRNVKWWTELGLRSSSQLEGEWLESSMIKRTHSWERGFHGERSNESALECRVLRGAMLQWEALARPIIWSPQTLVCWKMRIPEVGGGPELKKKVWASPQRPSLRNIFQELTPCRFPLPGGQRQLSWIIFCWCPVLPLLTQTPHCGHGRAPEKMQVRWSEGLGCCYGPF